MTGSSLDHMNVPSDQGTRGRRRRHLVTAAAGFAVGAALIVGTTSSSAESSANLYDSWQSNSWQFAPQLSQEQPTLGDESAGGVTSDLDQEHESPGRTATNTASRSGGAASADDTVVITGEKPASVAIPAMGVQAPVIPVGLDDGGGVFVPEDVRTLGWYTASVPVAADQGSAVIVGHRDSAVQGAGTFSGIENLAEGEVIEVTTVDGDVETYTVQEVRMVDKDDFASIANEAFAMNGEHRLTLITCGGAFDSAAGSYLSNVFVIATPNTA